MDHTGGQMQGLPQLSHVESSVLHHDLRVLLEKELCAHIILNNVFISLLSLWRWTTFPLECISCFSPKMSILRLLPFSLGYVSTFLK